MIRARQISPTKGKKRSILFLLWVFTGICGLAQTTIEGTIRDSIGDPVAYANIFIHESNDPTILAFTYSNNEGYYHIVFEKTGSFILNASSLTHKTKQLPLEITEQPSGKILRDITMQAQPFSLNEVIVNADIPILVKKDTIVINAESFVDGTEDVLEDVLKKLPGIDVTDDGTIQVQGKDVEKVMVEGDDLFEKGYKLLTRNLSAAVLDKVEILENFSDNALLKGLEDSQMVALNLTLKEDAKTRLFGTIGLGYGTGQYYHSKLNLISFRDKTKYYFLGNLNNTGEDVTGDIFQLLYPQIWSSVTYIGEGESAVNYMGIAAQSPDLNENRYNFNNAELASLNGIYNPTEKIKIKGLLFFTSDENDFVKRSIEQFTLPPDNFTNTENYRLRKISKAISAKWDAEISVGNNARLDYTGRYAGGEFRDRSELTYNADELTEALLNNTTLSDHRLTYTEKLNEKTAVQFTGRYIHDSKPQEYQADQVVFSDLFPSDDTLVFANQFSRNSLNYLGVEGSIHQNGKLGSSSVDMGYTQTTNRLTSRLQLTDSNQDMVDVADSFNNPFSKNRLGDLYTRLRYKFIAKAVSIRAGLEIHQLFSRVTAKEVTVSDHPVTWIPSMGIAWEINQKNQLVTNYSYSNRPMEADKIYPGYILTDFRSFARGLGHFRLLKGNSFLASYILGNWNDLFLINATFIYTRQFDYLSDATTVSKNFNLAALVALQNRDLYTYNITSDLFLNPLESNLKLKANYSNQLYQNRVNESGLRMVRAESIQYGAELRSAFEGFFNFHLGTKWIFSRIRTSRENSNTDNTSFLDLNFKVSSSLQFQFRNEMYTFGNPSQNSSYYFTDFNLRLPLLENRLKVNFEINNLWNTHTFSNYIISDTGCFSSAYKLLPRYFLLKMEYRF